MMKCQIPGMYFITYTTRFKFKNLTKQEIESIFVKILGVTVTKKELTQYSLIHKNSNGSFAELVDIFVKAHSGAQMVEKRMKDIFKIKQKIWSFSNSSQTNSKGKKMLLPPVPDSMVAVSFAKTLNERISEATRRLKKSL